MARLALPPRAVLRAGGRVTGEGALILALALASMATAGLAAGRGGSAGSGPTRRALAAVLAANLLVLPLVAGLLAWGLELGEAGAGLILVAAAPGGSTGPLMAVVAGGDARWAARLFLLLTAAGTGSALLAASALDAPGVARAAALVVATATAPLLAGWAAARWAPRGAARLRPWLSRASLLLLVATVALLAARHLHTATLEALAVSAALVAGSLLTGLLTAQRAQAIATAQVSAVRNLTLALLVLSSLGSYPAAIAAVLAYGLVMYVGAGAVAGLARYKGASPPLLP